jgi:hypothetical protein
VTESRRDPGIRKVSIPNPGIEKVGLGLESPMTSALCSGILGSRQWRPSPPPPPNSHEADLAINIHFPPKSQKSIIFQFPPSFPMKQAASCSQWSRRHWIIPSTPIPNPGIGKLIPDCNLSFQPITRFHR